MFCLDKLVIKNNNESIKYGAFHYLAVNSADLRRVEDAQEVFDSTLQQHLINAAKSKTAPKDLHGFITSSNTGTRNDLLWVVKLEHVAKILLEIASKSSYWARSPLTNLKFLKENFANVFGAVSVMIL